MPTPAAGAQEPSCPGCRAPLARSLRAAPLRAPVDGGGDGRPDGASSGLALPADAAVLTLYCGTCGRALGFSPAPAAPAPPTAGAAVPAATSTAPAAAPPPAAEVAPPPGARSPAPAAGVGGFLPGDRIVLQVGPFAGRDGVVRELDPEDDSLVVELAGFGRGRRLRVSPEALRQR